MSNNSETEPDIEDVSAKKRRRCSDVAQLSYNIMAQESLQNHQHKSSSTTMPEGGEQVIVANYDITTPVESTPSGTLLSVSQENIKKYVVIPESNQQQETSLSEEQCDLKSMKIDINTIKSELTSINDDMKTIMETLNTTQNNQVVIHNTLNSILLQVTELQVMHEEFIKKSIAEKQNHSLVLKPIKDLKDLEDFENKLIDSDYKEDLQRKLSVLCTKGREPQVHMLLLILCSKDSFFKSCLWTGASRSQNEPTEKICFKSFSKTIGFFFDIIHKLDSSFHLTDCHTFFKTILRNADQRCKTEPKRSSTKKCRGKKSVKKTSSENLVTNKTPPKQPPVDKQITGNQIEVEDVTEEIFV